uniref:Ig-like domain-containing protein n=1 Tax=Poecilia formosa TaxID=48698 RepID=A0A096M5V3_POEFO
MYQYIFSITPDKPRAKLTAGSTTIPVGGSVTLSCSVEPSAGWKYRWFRKTSGSFVEFSTNKEENGDITVIQGGMYMCMGMREKTDFYSDSSDEVTVQINCKFNHFNYFVTIAFLNITCTGTKTTNITCFNDDSVHLGTVSNKVFVTRQPNRPQIFSDETITLTCEVQGGETTEWTCEWKRTSTVIHKTNGKEWTFIVSESSSGDYMCQCRKRDDWFSSTQWSEAFRLSVSSKPKAQLNSNSREIPAGGSVTLTCTVTSSSSGWKYFWYKERDSSEPLTGEEADFPSNGQMNVSEEGLYWCRGGRGEPAYYTDYSDRISITKNVTVSSSASSSFPAMFVVGPFVGIVLIILLLLLWRYRLSKDLSCLRSLQSDSSSQRAAATNHGANETENHYRSLLHDEVVKYAKRRERPHPEKSCLYVNVMPGINSST